MPLHPLKKYREFTPMENIENTDQQNQSTLPSGEAALAAADTKVTDVMDDLETTKIVRSIPSSIKEINLKDLELLSLVLKGILFIPNVLFACHGTQPDGKASFWGKCVCLILICEMVFAATTFKIKSQMLFPIFVLATLVKAGVLVVMLLCSEALASSILVKLIALVYVAVVAAADFVHIIYLRHLMLIPAGVMQEHPDLVPGTTTEVLPQESNVPKPPEEIL